MYTVVEIELDIFTYCSAFRDLHCNRRSGVGTVCPSEARELIPGFHRVRAAQSLVFISQEKFENTIGIIRSRKLKEEGQYQGQKAMHIQLSTEYYTEN
jgi:hypothetical protein